MPSVLGYPFPIASQFVLAGARLCSAIQRLNDGRLVDSSVPSSGVAGLSGNGMKRFRLAPEFCHEL